MSAPPIPMIKWKPIKNAKMVIKRRGNMPPVCRYQTKHNTEPMAAAAFKKCPPGNFTAAEVTRPDNLP